MTLFEPPVYPPPAQQRNFGDALQRYRKLIAATRRRRWQWPSREVFTSAMIGRSIFRGWSKRQLRDHARATLRPQANADGYVLCCSPATEASIYENDIETVTWRRLRGIHRPVRLVGGDCNLPGADWVTLSMPYLAEVLPHARLTVLPGTTHMMVFEALQTCSDIIRKEIVAPVV